MSLDNYRTNFPWPGEKIADYCQRLVDAGWEEMLIRKALRVHFKMEVEDFGTFFENFGEARLRHLALLKRIDPNLSDYSLAHRTRKNLGISQERAEYWVKRLNQTPSSGE